LGKDAQIAPLLLAACTIQLPAAAVVPSKYIYIARMAIPETNVAAGIKSAGTSRSANDDDAKGDDDDDDAVVQNLGRKSVNNFKTFISP
jgi:hypothetical protein